ncbi:MAG TPA: hypothetical protein PKD86_08240 [Gemmatales bacterium]|nr:hypothetical protein [Gemmatales bacterium]HMP59329.1 hypothetical protein [Gemmatales bacterium]
MPRFHLPLAELTAEHRRSPIREVELDVNLPEAGLADAAAGPGPAFLQGGAQVEGQFLIDCPRSENRLRPGQLVAIKLTAADGRFSKVQFLLTELAGIQPKNEQERTYCWKFLVPGQPLSDAAGFFRRPGEPDPRAATLEPDASGTPWPIRVPRPVQEVDPAAREVTLGQLLDLLGTTMDQPAVRFTAEGGFIPTHSPEPGP